MAVFEKTAEDHSSSQSDGVPRVFSASTGGFKPQTHGGHKNCTLFTFVVADIVFVES